MCSLKSVNVLSFTSKLTYRLDACFFCYCGRGDCSRASLNVIARLVWDSLLVSRKPSSPSEGTTKNDHSQLFIQIQRNGGLLRRNSDGSVVSHADIVGPRAQLLARFVLRDLHRVVRKAWQGSGEDCLQLLCRTTGSTCTPLHKSLPRPFDRAFRIWYQTKVCTHLNVNWSDYSIWVFLFSAILWACSTTPAPCSWT